MPALVPIVKSPAVIIPSVRGLVAPYGGDPSLVLSYDLLGHNGGGHALEKSALIGPISALARSGDVGTAFSPAGVLTNHLANTPRFDHQLVNGVWVPRGLLIEQAGTNVCLHSESLDDAAWTKAQITISANAVAGPDGNTTMDKIVEDGTSNPRGINQIRYTTGQSNVVSFFLKSAGESRYIQVAGGGLQGAGEAPVFNPDTGTVDVPGTTVVFKEAKMTNVGNGIYLCRCRLEPTGTQFSLALTNSSTDNTQVSWAGDSSSGVYVWGVDVRNNYTVFDSYIPTTTTSVTRNADSCFADVTGLLPDRIGTVYAEWEWMHDTFTANPYIYSLGDGTADDRVFSTIINNDDLLWRVRSNGSTVADAINLDTNITANSVYKMCGAFATNNFAVSLNGSTPGTDTNGNTLAAAITDFDIGQQEDGSNAGNIWLRRAKIWNTRKPNGFLAQVTG